MKDLRTSIYDSDAKGGPSIIVKRDPRPDEIEKVIDYTLKECGSIDYASTVVGFLDIVLDPDKMDLLSTSGSWTWDEYQKECLRTDGWYASNKPRQGGISTIFAAKAFARGILAKNNYNAIFVSYKKEEAVNKINYVKQFLEALPLEFHKKIIRDPLQLIEWENANRTRSKIISHAQRPIRGINGDIFLDELAFYTIADEIYDSAVPAVGMSRSTIDVTSTPFGMGGKFWEIISDKVKFPNFNRFDIKWYDCKRYLKDESDEFSARASLLAGKLPLKERVYTYGNKQLIEQYENADDEATFQQEFEGHFVDMEAAFFYKDMIINCMFPTDVQNINDYDPRKGDYSVKIEEALSSDDDFNYPIVKKNIGRRTKDGRQVHFKTYNSIEQVYAAYRSGELSDNLLAGADIGKSQHSTHFVILEELELDNGTNLQIERFSLNRKDWNLTDQQSYFDNVLDMGMLRRMRLDRTGLGEQMGQFLEGRHGGVFEGVHMGGSNARQEEHMLNLKARMENGGLALAYDRQTIDDFYSIRRVVGPTKNIAYRAAERKRSHADSAWAISFASLIGTPYGEEPGSYNTSHSMMSVDRLSAQLGVNQNIDPDDHDGGFGLVTRGAYGSKPGLTREETRVFRQMNNVGRFISDYDR